MNRRFAWVMLTLVLAACGGGGDNPTAPLSTTPDTTLPHSSGVIPSASYPAGSAELGAWQVLQQARVLCGFGVLTQDTRLDAAALSHARYLNSISLASGVSELSHYETITTDPHYTGYYPWDRTVYQGYGNQVAEILEATYWDYGTGYIPYLPSMSERGASSMRSLLNTVYHLSGAMFEGADVGFGAELQTVSSGTSRHEEYRFGSLNGFQNYAKRVNFGVGKFATYPCQGSTDIPSAFSPALESPNPFPEMTSQVQRVGPPIYIKADRGQVLTLNAGSVMQGGNSVATVILTHANDAHVPSEIEPHEAFVVPVLPLQPFTSYQVTVSGKLNGVAFSRTFSMATGS